ncbi:CsbD family protein [Lacticaseibacillus yichunensis]|uniref:CsbD family protein n=1 Tax=Lacticaseibacillus yichunensis TaxID=2486015 RepID=A0ABW4CSL3_9LACO|nr:CsbD family protein [Lacticaseibacillus yichunensis]
MTDFDAMKDKVVGKVKETAGKVSGDEKLEAKGKAEQMAGEAKDKAAELKKKAEDATDDATDKVAKKFNDAVDSSKK